MSPLDSTRRAFLAAAAGLLLTPLSARAAYAAVGPKKLIVLICRGGMDGLSVVPPIGDPSYRALRGAIALGGFGEPGGALPLDSVFGLHPSLSFCHGLAQQSQLRVAPSVSTPERSRSHFQSQDVLEAGTAKRAAGVGWLNRTLTALGAAAPSAISVGRQSPLILRGPAPSASWSPGHAATEMGDVGYVLQDLYRNDPLLAPALARGLETEIRARIATRPTGPGRSSGFGETRIGAVGAGPAIKLACRMGLHSNWAKPSAD
jgi:uncharacterized protein (DUF1501 family)